MRPIKDLKLLNNIIVNKAFRMESARTIQSAMKPNQWYISIDLMDAYLHIPIHPNFGKYLRFAVIDHVYQFTALPFGHVIAPRIFTEVMREIAIILRKSITIHMYLDDWIIREDKQEVLMIQSVIILELCNLLGLLVNIPKSELTPAQILEYVGILFDLAVGREYPPQKRIQKIYNIVSHIMYQEQSPASMWLSLLGLINSVTDRVPLGRLHCRPLQYFLRSKWIMAVDARNTRIHLEESVIHHLKW